MGMGMGGYMDANRGIPTPAAMPSMMQQQTPNMYQGGYNPGYPQQNYGQPMGGEYPMQGMQGGYGMAPQQQPMMPQMEYGQSYGGGMQNQPQMPQQQPAAQQPMMPQQQPNAMPTEPMAPPQQEAPASPNSNVERDDLGVPAFLRRSNRK